MQIRHIAELTPFYQANCYLLKCCMPWNVNEFHRAVFRVIPVWVGVCIFKLVTLLFGPRASRMWVTYQKKDTSIFKFQRSIYSLVWFRNGTERPIRCPAYKNKLLRVPLSSQKEWCIRYKMAECR